VTPAPRLIAVAALLTTSVGVLCRPAAADPLQSAQTRAHALAAEVSHLQDAAEVASQRYDAVEEKLARAVSTQLSDGQQLDSVRNAAASQQAVLDSQAQLLYETGGQSTMLAALVTGTNPLDALERLRLAGTVLDYDSQQVEAAGQVVDHAATLESNDTTASHAVLGLQAQATRAAAQVQRLLASARSALASATATVRRIEAADAAAAAAAGAQAFNTAVAAAGGTLRVSGSDAAPNATAAAAIAAAKTRLGDPYVWGATGPDSFDCSGLTQWSYAHAGITLPRTAAEQWNSGPHPSLSQLEPGDLLFWALNTSDPATIHHVTIYLGGGMMIAAPHTGENVQIQPVYMTGFIGATRPWAHS